MPSATRRSSRRRSEAGSRRRRRSGSSTRRRARPTPTSLSAGAEVVQLAEAPAEAGPAEAQAGDDRHEADEQLSARLVALQMAVAGGNRGDVEVHLRETFGIEDPVAILDDVFGPGTDAEKRV